MLAENDSSNLLEVGKTFFGELPRLFVRSMFSNEIDSGWMVWN